jgi:Tfp pilus assembly protein PilV
MRSTALNTPYPARRLRRLTSGFTILEVALASSVMAMGIATSIIAMQTGFRFIDVARDTTLASQILQSEIERIRMMNWGAVSTLPAEATVDLSTMFTSDANLASRFTVVRQMAADGARPADVRLITLRVTWRSYDGRTHTRSFQAKYVKNGLYDYYYTLAGPPA